MASAGPSLQADFRDIRSEGTLGNPNAVAIYLVLTVPCILYGIEQRLINRNIGRLIFGSVVVGILCTISRKGYATLIIAILLFYYFKKQTKKILILVYCTLLLTVFLTGFGAISGRFDKENVTKTLNFRKSMVIAGLKMFADRPVHGYGYNGFYERSYLYVYDSLKWAAHNMYITVLVNYGLLGFMPFLGMLIYPVLFAKQIIRLMQDTDLQLKLSTSGRAYIESLHSWCTIGSKLERIYLTAIQAAAKKT